MEGVEPWAMEKVFWSVSVSGVPWAVRVLENVHPAQVSVEACVACSEAGDCCVNGSIGGISLPLLGGGLCVYICTAPLSHSFYTTATNGEEYALP